MSISIELDHTPSVTVLTKLNQTPSVMMLLSLPNSKLIVKWHRLHLAFAQVGRQ